MSVESDPRLLCQFRFNSSARDVIGPETPFN